MKKTLIVTIDFPPNLGGIASYWDYICSNLPKDRFTVLTIPADNVQDKEYKVIRKSLFFSWLWPRWVKGVFYMLLVFKKEKCEQIYADQVLPVGVMAYVLYKAFGIPYIIQVHGRDIKLASRNPRKQLLAKKVFDHAKHVVVNSKTTGLLLEEYFGRKSYTVNYPLSEVRTSIDQSKIEKLRQLYNLKSKTILTVGRLIPRKGQDMVIKAMTKVWQKHPNVDYVLIGDGSYIKELEILAGGDKRIKFMGPVSHSEIPEWMALSDIFVMTSRITKDDIESFGIVYTEASKFAKPVIAGNVGGALEAVKDGVSGKLVDPENIDEIAETIIYLLDNPGYAESLGQNGKKWVEDNFNTEKLINRLVKILS